MKNKLFPLLASMLVALALPLPLLSHAQTTSAATDASATQPMPLTSGEVRRVDREGGKVTIKHGEIKNLDMPPMTMVFVAKDAAQLAPLKVGDRVNFMAMHEGGKYIAAEIQAAK